MEGTDVCYAPVLRMSEAAQHPHNVARNTFIEVGGVTQPAPAPRYSRTATDLPTAPAHAGQHTRDVLADWGIDTARINALITSGAVRQA
jgi:alpha-methylacyl-CoA racemase